MKPNLEISLKFWIALIVFFAVVLFIPFCEYLSDNYSVIICTITAFIYVSTFIFCIDLLLRNSELKSKLRKESFYRTVSAQTIDDYEHQIKLQECQIEDRKKYFEDAVAEITELRSKNKNISDNFNELTVNYSIIQEKISLSEDELRIAYERIEALNQGNKVLLESRDYWRERTLHQKHTKKEAESEWWQCVNSIGEYFIKGNKYKQVNNKSGYFYLIGETSITHIVKKSNFKPVKC